MKRLRQAAFAGGAALALVYYAAANSAAQYGPLTSVLDDRHTANIQFTAADAGEVGQRLDEAQALIAARRYEEALDILDQVVARDPDSVQASEFASIAASRAGLFERATVYLENLVRLMPRDLGTRFAHLQGLVFAGDRAGHDRAREAFVKYWRESDDSEVKNWPFFPIEVYRGQTFDIRAMQYFELFGPNPILYKFLITRRDSSSAGFISLGSYEKINQIEKEIGRLPDGVRLFHLDGYSPSETHQYGSHYTYAFYEGEPSYWDIRDIVIEVVESGDWRTRAVSGSGRDPDASHTIR